MRKIVNFCLVLALMMGLCIPAFAAGQTFCDVPAGVWYTKYIERAAANKWVSGVGGGKYQPNAHVTYGQFCTMICNALYPQDVAAEPAGGQWWERYVRVAAKHGLLASTNMDQTAAWSIYAGKDISREEMAIILRNALRDAGAAMPTQTQLDAARAKIVDYSSIGRWGQSAVTICYSMGLLSGYSDGRFGPSDTMTRAQAATVLCNVYDAINGSDPEVGQPDIPATSDVTVTPYCTPGSSPAIIGLHVVAPASAKLHFSIRLAEDYSGVVMPSNTDAYVYGTGDATFEPITFTEAGTYSFTIKEEEGMENYRYDAREWTVTVTVTGSMGAPVGTIGGQYDVSRYTVPADANKDGYITEAEVQAVLDALKVEFPGGTLWNDASIWGTDRTSPNGYINASGEHYYKSPAFPGATGCAAWATLVSDKIFGNLPKRSLMDAHSMKPGDVECYSGGAHWAVNLGAIRYPQYPETTDGNSGKDATISWGGYGMTWDEIQTDVDAGRINIYTRFPEGEASMGDMAVASATYTCSDGKTGDKASFISTCLNAPTWSDETVAKARKIMADMTLEEKVGQMFLLHYPSDGAGTVAQAKDLINKYHPGGFLVFAAMFEKNTPTGVQKKIADTQAGSDIPLLFTVDEEGGIAASGNRVVRVSKFSQYGHAEFQSPQELKANGGLPAVTADAKDKAAAAL